MGVLAARPERHTRARTSPALLAILAGLTYAVVVAVTAAHHEPWADEAQSWLLARDVSLGQLWTSLLHYEGTPGLWQTILHALIQFGMPYGALNFVSALAGLGACILMLSRAPFPIAFRIALPFTFYLCYQYSVVARSYCLLPFLLFGAAILYEDGLRQIALFNLVLCLMAAISVHGMAISASIWLAFHAELVSKRDSIVRLDGRRILAFGAAYLLVILLLIGAAWPASDNMFVTRPNWSLEHLWTTAGKALSGGFTGSAILSLAVIALSLPLLWRGRALPFLALSILSLLLLNGIVYSQVWHFGLPFLAWLFALWIASVRVKPDRAALTALALVICIQCYWTVQTISYDLRFPYSAGKEAAIYLKQANLPARRLFAIGYACVAIEPYFPRNIFANVRDGGGPAYWDWSTRNHVNEDSEHLSTKRPEYVIVGYKGAYERDLWTAQIRQSGYQPVRHFEGNTYWQTAILEPESFDLYRRPAQ